MAANWTAADLPRQDGKVVIVTGANSGLGFHAALELGRAGAEVILACRDAGRGQAALDRMLAEVPDGRYELRSLDLSDLGSVRAFAAGAPERIDVLCNNAGVMATPYRTTSDGFEMQFGTNYLGHFALTGLLLERLLAADAPRVVTAGSNMHKMGKIPWDDLNSEQKYKKWSAYSNSKLANLCSRTSCSGARTRPARACSARPRTRAGRPPTSTTRARGSGTPRCRRR